MRMRAIGFLLALMAMFISASGVTAATAAGFSKLGSLPMLAWGLFYALFGFVIALVVIGLIDVATGGHLRKFMGGLL